MRKLGNGNNVSGKQNNVTILILTFIMIILVVFSISISCGPKNVEKYIGKLHKLKEKYQNETNEKELQKIKKHEERTYKKLANAIKRNLLRIMKKNKCIDGSKIIIDDNEWSNGIERLKKCQINETTDEDGTHTIDKHLVYLCDPDNPNDHTLTHVIIHEYAHVINETIGHDEPWKRLFNILQDCAHNEGWFDRTKHVELSSYCSGRYLLM